MANLTIVIDDEMLKRARIKALEEGTSVNALLRDYLERYTGTRARQAQAAAEFLRLAKTSGAERGDKQWTRDDLYER